MNYGQPYNAYGRPGEYGFVVTAITGAVALTGAVIGAVASGKQRKAAEAQAIAAQADARAIQAAAIAQQHAARYQAEAAMYQSKQRTTAYVGTGVVLASALVAGVIIYSATKNKKR